MKRRFAGLIIMIFVIICGLGLGFGFHYGEFFIIPNTSGSTESSDNQNFDNSGNIDNENSDNSNNNNENIDNSENDDKNDNEVNNDKEENIIPDNPTDTTNPEEPESPEIPTEPEDDSEENNLTIYYQEIEKEVGKLKDHIYMMTGVEANSAHDKGIEEIEYVFTFNIDEMLEMGMICGFEDVQFIVENYLANDFAIQSECYEFAYVLDETSGTLVLNFSVAEEK